MKMMFDFEVGQDGAVMEFIEKFKNITFKCAHLDDMKSRKN
jgi:hypothetical protein